MKKVISLLLILACCLSLCACGGTPITNIEETTTELTVIEKIQQVESVSELDEYVLANYPDENQENAIVEKWKELFLTTFSGYYYSRTRVTPFLESKMKQGENFTLDDDRAVYIKSEDEIYFMPISEAEMKEKGLSLEDIPNMENSEKYCYKAIGYDDSFTVDLINKYYENTDAPDIFKELHIWCDLEDGNFEFGGYFADQIAETVDGFATAEQGEITDKESIENAMNENIEMVPIGRDHYYNNEADALAAKKAYEDEKAAEEQADKNLKNSIPRVGMTAAQVKKTKWGYPDKVNKDTYGDRVKEQWVYSSYGYVYLTNGVVTAIQER